MSKRKDDFEDDGRVIANMNVDGMPWHDPVSVKKNPVEAEQSKEELGKLSKKETFHLILGVLGAALAVAAVFAIGFLLFILFCEYVWFK